MSRGRGLKAAALCAMLISGSVSAATCSVSTAGVAFGTYNSNQKVHADSVGSLVVSCEKSALESGVITVTYSLEMSRGSGGSYSPRTMTSGAHTLQYNSYTDLLRTTPWGDSTGGSMSVTGALQLQNSPGMASATHNIYGRVFSNQNVFPGAYADSVTVTIVY
jgi:spore coat protein U-like protein